MTVRGEIGPWAGKVAPGFEPVLEAFRLGLDDFGAGGGAFCAYHRGRLVVDLQGGWARPGEPWREDTLATLFSSTKGLATLCLQILVDRGSLDLDARVSDLWPEFEQAGKGTVRVQHVLAHTAGVLAPNDPGSFLRWGDAAAWDDDVRLDAALAAATPAPAPAGATFAYHAITFGWLVSAIVRRVSGTSVGAFLEAEVARPLDVDVRIGTPRVDQARIAPVIPEPAVELLPDDAALAARIRSLARDPSTLIGRSLLALPDGDLIDNVTALNDPGFQEVEIPAINGTATAGGLARLYATLAGGGELDGVRIVSAAAINQFRTVQVHGPNAMELEWDPAPSTVELHLRMLGYHGSSKPFGLPRRLGPSLTAFGHDGLGGQIAFADPERSLAAVYVRNRMTSSPAYSARLLELLYACADRAWTSAGSRAPD